MASTISEITNSPLFPLMLRLIKGHNDVSPLLKKGATYADIFQMLNAGEDQGYLRRSNSTLTLTERGKILIEKLPNSSMKSEGWIGPPSPECRRSQIGKEEIFLPPLDCLHKLT